MTSLIALCQQPVAHALGWTLLHFCWQGLLLAILLASVLWLLRGSSADVRYATACGALALMVTMPVATFVRLATAAQADKIQHVTVQAGGEGFAVANGSGPEQPWLDRLAERLDHSLPWILSIWCAGVVFLLAQLNLGLIAAHRMKSSTDPAPDELQLTMHRLSERLGIERSIKLAISALVQVPTVVGWLRPAILIPIGCFAGLSSSQVEAILAHELAHIRRHDYLVSVLQSAIETLLFYHPAVWWMSKQVRREREALLGRRISRSG